MPVRFTAYDGSAAGPADADDPPAAEEPSAGCAYLLTAPGDLGHGARLRVRRPGVDGVHPGDPYDALRLLQSRPAVPHADAGRGARAAARRSGWRNLKPPPPPPQETCRAGAGWSRALRHSMAPRRRGDPPPLRRLQPVLRAGARPVDDLHLRGLPDAGRDAGGGAGRKYDLVARKLDLKPGHAAARRRLRLGRHGPPRGQRVRRQGARRDAVAREQAAWARRRSSARARPTSPRCGTPTTATCAESDFDAISSIGLTEHIGVRQLPGVLRRSCATSSRPQGRLLNHCITRPHNQRSGDRARSSTATSSPTAS